MQFLKYLVFFKLVFEISNADVSGMRVSTGEVSGRRVHCFETWLAKENLPVDVNNATSVVPWALVDC